MPYFRDYKSKNSTASLLCVIVHMFTWRYLFNIYLLTDCHNKAI